VARAIEDEIGEHAFDTSWLTGLALCSTWPDTQGHGCGCCITDVINVNGATTRYTEPSGTRRRWRGGGIARQLSDGTKVRVWRRAPPLFVIRACRCARR